MATATTPATEMTSYLERPFRITVGRYYRMIEAGVFDDGPRLFLWKGRLVEKMTKHPPHENARAAAAACLFRITPAGWHVRVESPVALDAYSAPEPDLVVLRGAIGDYAGRPPAPRNVALVVEVADSSVRADQGEMLESFARESIPVYGIVNLPGRRVEVYTGPTGPAERPSYRSAIHYAAGQHVPLVLDGAEVGRVAAADILP